MLVIKKGKFINIWASNIFKGICNTCDCEFECNDYDVHEFVLYAGPMNSKHPFYITNCPCCEQTVIVYKKNLCL